MTIAGTVQPLSITVSNSSLAYVFSGAGSIAGTTALTKQGPGSSEINMAGNTYSGGTNLLAACCKSLGITVVGGGTARWASGPSTSAAAPCKRRGVTLATP